MRKVVVNTTPLIALSHVGRLDILKELYGEILYLAESDRVVFKSSGRD